MKKYACLLTTALLLYSCYEPKHLPKEPWIDQPVSEWPNFALTNEIAFGDTTYVDLANAFLIDTGRDTLAVSCKHLFILFQMQRGMSSITLGDDFKEWYVYPKNQKDNKVALLQLINSNPAEAIGEFRILKDRDWIVMQAQEEISGIYPLKIRYRPIKRNEIVYAIGWSMQEEDREYPAKIKMQCVKNLGPYFYVNTLSKDVNAHGRSGSAVIDQNGYLVGIVSGQEGKLGVMGSIQYLRQVFEQYGIPFLEAE